MELTTRPTRFVARVFTFRKRTARSPDVGFTFRYFDRTPWSRPRIESCRAFASAPRRHARHITHLLKLDPAIERSTGMYTRVISGVMIAIVLAAAAAVAQSTANGLEIV